MKQVSETEPWFRRAPQLEVESGEVLLRLDLSVCWTVSQKQVVVAFFVRVSRCSTSRMSSNGLPFVLCESLQLWPSREVCIVHESA